jgi:multidrug efflux pump
VISRIFIDRPVFAWVIAIVIMLAGVAGLTTLSVAQYPDVAPPTVNIRTSYPGASAQVVENSVTQIVEQQLTNVDGLLYFQSTSNSAGGVQITVTFEKGTNPDTAQMQVQNKVQQAIPRLPQDVQRQGVVVTKSNPDILMVVSIYDKTDRLRSMDVADYLVSHMQEPVGRLEGVGDIIVYGTQYAMRIWMDPYKLASYKLMPSDITAAITAQNAQVAAGQVGALPSLPGQGLNATVMARERLTTPAQFEKIIVKTQSDGSRVLLSDVARIELGQENYSTTGRLNGHPASALVVNLSPGADALKTAELVRAEVSKLSKDFPKGFEYAYPNDATNFIKLSVHEVVLTLLAAVALVVVVMFVFLHSWRATLIPAIAVPVVMLGTFGILAVAGFSINVLTLFGLVLSIGLLVDDAIVVVENVERVMSEEPDISARDATIKSMNQVQTALIAIALVLSAVFLPMAFFGGSVGVIYRQFSITIVSSMVLSVIVALILTPALASRLLKRGHEDSTGIDRWLHHFGIWFNERFNRAADNYRGAVTSVIKHTRVALFVYVAVVIGLAVLFKLLPTSFLPSEDQAIAQMQYTLPPGATLERTTAVIKEVETYFTKHEPKNISIVNAVIGQNRDVSGQNTGRGFVAFAPWDQRHGAENSAENVAKRANAYFKKYLRDAQVFILNPPPVRGIGQSSGFTLELLNSGSLPRAEFQKRLDTFMTEANADPVLSNVRMSALEDTPTLHIDVDQEKVGALGIQQSAVDSTLSTAWGGTYVNDFIDHGRVKRVYVQGDAPYRSRPEDLSNWFVRTGTGDMAPFSAFATTRWTLDAVTLNRFNGVPVFEISGDAGPGKSTGQAMDRLEEIAAPLQGVSVAWSGLSYQEKLSGSQAPLLYGVSMLVVFLCLAALYESWSVPLAVLLVVPLGLIGAALAVFARGLPNDVYFQVGLVTTMGLASKNAILIIEFAEQGQREGKSAFDAAVEAARLRLRPILMTSFAFMAGVAPLAIATGAGAKSRVAIGTAVVGGMVSAVGLAIFFVPMFFVLVRKFFPGGHELHIGEEEHAK